MSRTDTWNAPLFASAFDGDLARIGELDGVADQIDQDLRQAAAVAMAGWQLGGDVDLERQLLIGSQGFERAAYSLGDIPNAVIR